MEVDESPVAAKPPRSDSQTSLQRKKKKSAVSKLVEKKKRNSAESGSEFGSTYSLQSNVDIVDNVTKNKDSEADNKNNNSNTDSQDNNKSDQQGKSNKNSGNTPPKPKPRETTHEFDTSQLSPPPPHMDIDSESDDEKNDDKNSGTINKKAPSDATIHRFRALKMVNERTNSVESLKNSPFMPKPPTTPKGEKVKIENISSMKSSNSHKGEKRNREPYSSSEEIESKSKKQSSSNTDLKSMDDVFTTETASKKKEKKERKHSKKRGTKTNESDDEIMQVSNKYEEILAGDSVPPKDDTNSMNKSPRGGRLSPITSKTHPPPLPDIASASLRTAYKNDSSLISNKSGSPSTPGSRNPFDKMSSQYAGSADNLSNRSMSVSTTGIIQPISVKEARERSSSASTGGNISVSSTLLGASELDRYFPDRRLKVWIGSWNMGDIKECKQSIEDFLLPESSEFVQDIYAIGTQENNINKREWEVMIQTTLGPSHVLFFSTTHGALHLAIFIRRDLIWFCSEPEEDLVTTRAVTMVKTKGAVAISFSFFGTSFLFINSHLASDAGKIKERISDYQKINTSLKLPKNPSGSQSNLQADATSKHDAVFWFGDLNFRLEKGRHTVDGLVSAIVEQEHPNFEDLLQGDELTQCILKDAAFQGYQEGRINFKPTYKFDLNKDDYDTSPKFRIPSYTDRILFHCRKKNSVSCIHYDSVMNLRISDHRPVYGLYEAAIKPGRENVQLAAGKFDRDVYVQANRRRTVNQTAATTSQKSSGVCSVQ